MNELETQKLIEDLKRAFLKHHLLSDCTVNISVAGEILVNRNHWTKTAIGHLITVTDVTDCNFKLHPAGFHIFR